MVSASIATALVTPLTPAIDRALAHHGRMHALFDAGIGALRDAKQLHAITELVGGIEIGERDRFDAFDMHGLGIHFACRKPGW